MKSVFYLLVLAIIGLSFEPPPGMDMVFSDDFENQSLGKWKLLDEEQWKIDFQDENAFASQFREGNYNPPHRSLKNFALIQNLDLGEFILTAKVRSTSRVYGHQDICVVFGYQDSARFYYAHIARKKDGAAHHVHIVNNAARSPVTSERTNGFAWSDGWHRIRVERNNEKVSIFMDDMNEPVLVSQDSTFMQGNIGFGTFDDTFDLDDVKVWAPAGSVGLQKNQRPGLNLNRFPGFAVNGKKLVNGSNVRTNPGNSNQKKQFEILLHQF